MNELDPNDPQTRVSTRMVFLKVALLELRGIDPQPILQSLPTYASHPSPPPCVSWADYITLIDRLGEAIGGGPGIRRAIKEAQKGVYSEIRALAGFFPSLVPFYSFVGLQLMPQMSPACRHVIEALSENSVRATYGIVEGCRGSRLFWDGTVALAEVFPTHVDLPEANVEVVRMSDRELELVVEFPVDTRPDAGWGVRRAAAPVADTERLTLREQQVLDLVAKGYTNAEIGSALGTAPSTVKNQISTILTKMDAANRTELAARAARKSAMS